MLLDQETLRFIFGLKLKSFRQEKGLSLQELSRTSKLSPSYLNEIENGKKYPKSEKIALLASSLGVAYDDLISLKLKKEMGLLSALLEKNLLRGLPFELFGVPAQTLLTLVAERPAQVGALVGTLLELSRNFQLNVEEFFHAALRAYLDLNENYFPEIEEAAQRFRKELINELGLSEQKPAYRSESLVQWLKSHYQVEVQQKDFEQFPAELHHLYFLYVEEAQKKLYLNLHLEEREKIFILMKEIGFCELKLSERLPSTVSSLDSFGKLLGNFKASYFSSSVLIPEKKFIDEISLFFKWKKFDAVAFLDWAHGYPGTMESFFYRLTQLLPKHFGINELFYIRLTKETKRDSLELSRELHLSSLHGPHKAKDNEHYCRRWVTSRLLAEWSKGNKFDAIVGAQRSAFFGSDNEYLCLSIASPAEGNSSGLNASTIGLHLSAEVKKTIKFIEDSEIEKKHVGDTCERCGIMDCQERVANPTLYQRKERDESLQQVLNKVISDLGEKKQLGANP